MQKKKTMLTVLLLGAFLFGFARLGRDQARRRTVSVGAAQSRAVSGVFCERLLGREMDRRF